MANTSFVTSSVAAAAATSSSSSFSYFPNSRIHNHHHKKEAKKKGEKTTSSTTTVPTTTATTATTSSSSSSTAMTNFEKALKTRGLELVEQEGDGNCLFRAVSFQVYGDANAHLDVRKRCMDFMVCWFKICVM